MKLIPLKSFAEIDAALEAEKAGGPRVRVLAKGGWFVEAREESK